MLLCNSAWLWHSWSCWFSLICFYFLAKNKVISMNLAFMYKVQPFIGLRVTFGCMVCISVNTDICAHINWTQCDHFCGQNKKTHTHTHRAHKKRRAFTIFVAVIFLSYSHLHTHLNIHTHTCTWARAHFNNKMSNLLI